MWRGIVAALAALAVGACSATSGLETCGIIDSQSLTPTARNIHPLEVAAVDGQNVLPKEHLRLAPGTHELKVYELIKDPRLLLASRHRGESKMLTVEIDADEAYYLGAEFLEDKRYSMHNEYWRPVVWKKEKRACHP